MTEFAAVIAETEGIRTPKATRTKADVDKAFKNFTEKRAARKKAAGEPKSKKAGKSAKAERSAAAKTEAQLKPSTGSVDAIPMNYISPDGFVREAAFDPKTKLFYVTFAKSTWAFPATAEEWATFEKAVADPLTNIDTHYRKAFRGRGADMKPVRKSEEVKA